MKKLTLLALALALGLATVGGAGAAASFSDPPGDAGGAPDVTAVQVANDDAGAITFQIAIANQTTLAQDAVVSLVVDSDANPDTGDEDGFDTIFLFGPANAWVALRWNGSDYATAAAPSGAVSMAANTLRFTLSKTDLANTKAFAFYLETAQFDSNDEVIASDVVPDGDDVWEYTLTVPLTLSSAKPAAAAPAKAGKPFAVTMAVTRSDTNAAVTAGKVTCAMTVSGKPVRAGGRFLAGKARCAATMPSNAKGKTVRGTITVTVGTAKVSKPFSFRVG